MRNVALVTGSSRGIGLATAIELAREGFAVAVNGPADDMELARAVDTVATEGHPVMAAPFDVTDTTSHRDWLRRIEDELGPLTTLVNNAGIGAVQRGDLLEVTEESYDRCLAVNTKAMFFLSQAFAKCLLARERPAVLFHSIVNVTSSNAVAVAVQRTEYAASKAAAAMVSKSFAVRLGPGHEGIRLPGRLANRRDVVTERHAKKVTLAFCVEENIRPLSWGGSNTAHDHGQHRLVVKIYIAGLT